MAAENQPKAYPEHTYMHSYLVHHIQSSYKTVPYTFNIGYRALTFGSNRAGQLLTKILLRLYGGQKKLAKETLLGKKIRQDIWVGTMAQTLCS